MSGLCSRGWLPRKMWCLSGWRLLAAYKECGFFGGRASFGVGAVAVGRLLRHKHLGFHTCWEEVLAAALCCVVAVLADLILSDITSSAH